MLLHAEPLLRRYPADSSNPLLVAHTTRDFGGELLGSMGRTIATTEDAPYTSGRNIYLPAGLNFSRLTLLTAEGIVEVYGYTTGVLTPETLCSDPMEQFIPIYCKGYSLNSSRFSFAGGSSNSLFTIAPCAFVNPIRTFIANLCRTQVRTMCTLGDLVATADPDANCPPDAVLARHDLGDPVWQLFRMVHWLNQFTLTPLGGSTLDTVRQLLVGVPGGMREMLVNRVDWVMEEQFCSAFEEFANYWSDTDDMHEVVAGAWFSDLPRDALLDVLLSQHYATFDTLARCRDIRFGTLPSTDQYLRDRAWALTQARPDDLTLHETSDLQYQRLPAIRYLLEVCQEVGYPAVDYTLIGDTETLIVNCPLVGVIDQPYPPTQDTFRAAPTSLRKLVRRIRDQISDGRPTSVYFNKTASEEVHLRFPELGIYLYYDLVVAVLTSPAIPNWDAHSYPTHVPHHPQFGDHLPLGHPPATGVVL